MAAPLAEVAARKRRQLGITATVLLAAAAHGGTAAVLFLGGRATLQEAVLIEPRATLSHCLTDMPALATMRSALHCDDVLGLELVPRESMLTYKACFYISNTFTI